MIALGVYHIDKPRFLELLLEARKKTFSEKNIASGFRATGLLPFDPTQVLCRLQTKIRTPSPPPAPNQPPSLPLKTPVNIVELDSSAETPESPKSNRSGASEDHQGLPDGDA
jgi:hypothetical protein